MKSANSKKYEVFDKSIHDNTHLRKNKILEKKIKKL